MSWLRRLRDRKGPGISHFSWLNYLITLGIMALISVLPVIMLGGGEVILSTGRSYFLWFFLFWAMVALIFCVVTAWQKYQAFDRPMKLLGDAARRVAEGDFTVHIKPLHSSKQQQYVDYMFQDFNKMVEELSSLETMKNDFIANVSHEFKTPLAVIQNYAADLKYMDLPPEKQKEYLDTILTSAQNLGTLVTNILRLNKIENQTISPQKKPYDLCRQLCDCVIAFGDRWEEKGIDFSAEIEDERIVQADAELLSLVWNNLLSNSIKFTERGGCVTLRQTCEADVITVSVSDTGCGMSEDTVRHVFDKFYQGDTSRAQEGNGLGLALAKRVVELCEGSISVESTPGQGSVFTVTLPNKTISP